MAVTHTDDRSTLEPGVAVHQPAILLKTEALQSAIFNSANFSSIATDAGPGSLRRAGALADGESRHD